jgi:hypothetical protein
MKPARRARWKASRWARVSIVALLLTSGLLPRGASADEAPAPPSSSSSSSSSSAPLEQKARDSFLRGVALVREARWSDALVAFDDSVAERPHPVTFFNMALCHRALGQPVRAVFALERALALDEAAAESPKDRLPEATLAETRALLAELRTKRVFVVLDNTETDSELAITVDGQSLDHVNEAWVKNAGTTTPTPFPPGKMRLALDPGRHILRVSARGREPWLRDETFSPAEVRQFVVAVKLLPGILAVRARVPGASLLLDQEPPIPLPTVLERTHGLHRVEVRKPGFVPFVSEVTLRPGERADVVAELPAEKVPITKKWWFYAGIGAAVVAAGVTTYALTRPTEKADGGSLGWVVRP